MKKPQRLLTVILLTAVIVAVIAVPATAALVTKTIQVSTGVTIYVDDVKLSPKDSAGNPVEPFIYNGTTYLPVRAIGEAFGKAITWEASTQSVYLGKHASDKPNVWLKDMEYFSHSGWEPVYRENEKDNTGTTYSNTVRSGNTYSWSRVYKLNGQYSKFTGTYFWLYDYRSTSSNFKSTFKVYADGELVFDAEINKQTDPVLFDIPLNGVLELKIVWCEGLSGNNGCCYSALGDCGFYQ